MKSVCIIQEHLPHYRVRFYEELHHKLLARGIGLKLIYSPFTAPNLIAGHLSWAHPIPIIRFGKFAWQAAFKEAMLADLVIVQQEAKYLLNYVLHIVSCLGGPKIAFWGHGRNFQAASERSYSEGIKRFVSLHVDWWFAYNDLSASVLQDIGYPNERITSVMNAIDTENISAARKAVSPAQLEAVYREIKSRSANIAVYTGGLYAEKRVKFLIDSCARIRREVPDFELIIIGKGPEASIVQQAASNTPWLHYVGAKSDIEKIPYWAVSKVLLMPGLVGLVILDSFATGVPIVATDFPYHSPEISYLRNGENGVMLPDWRSGDTYAMGVVELLQDEQKLEHLRRGCQEDAPKYTVGEMADRFAEGITSALEAPRYARRSLFGR